MTKLLPGFSEKIPQLEHTEALKKIINDIDLNHWDDARQKWFIDVMGKDISKKTQINFYGTMQEFFFQYMYAYQTHDLIQKCSTDCILNGNLIISDNSNFLLLGRLQKNKSIHFVSSINKCDMCNARVTCSIHFKNSATFFFIETTSRFKINELPKTLEIENKTYKLLIA